MAPVTKSHRLAVARAWEGVFKLPTYVQTWAVWAITFRRLP